MRRSAVWAACVTAAVLVLGGCGGGSGDGMQVVTGARAERLIAASADKAEAAKTARMAGTIKVQLRGKPTTVDMDGVMDFRSQALQFDLDLGAMAGAAGAQMQMRMVDGVMYMGFDAKSSSARRAIEDLTGGKHWIKVDPAEMGLGASGSLDDSNPGATMDTLRGIDDVERVGEESVRGVTTTHYRGTIDLSKAEELLPDDARGSLDKLGGLFTSDWVADVWVDADGQTRRMRINVDGSTVQMTEEFEFFDFGVPVDLSTPAPEDVVSFQDVFGPLGSARFPTRDSA